jgi:tetratricopeptide (TPR) repeat protein
MRRASPESAADPSVSIAYESLLDARFDRVITNLVAADPKLLATAFLKGLAFFGKNELEPAAAQFRAALDAAPDFLPAAFYLGACYAAGGRDREAVGAWQTALITESDARIIYDVLGDALLRMQDGDEAASILTEARDKWMDDDRFVPRLAASGPAAKPEGRIALLDAVARTLRRERAPARRRDCSTRRGRPAGGLSAMTTPHRPAATLSCSAGRTNQALVDRCGVHRRNGRAFRPAGAVDFLAARPALLRVVRQHHAP